MSSARPVAVPGRPLDYTVELPGSKSITNRALLIAALAEGPSTLSRVLFSDDTEAMLGVLAALGIDTAVDRGAAQVVVTGTGGRLRAGPLDLDARSAGTVARFVPPVLLLGSGRYRLDGSDQLRRRPLGHLVESLRELGGSVTESSTGGRLPLVISGSGGSGLASVVHVAADVSSQFVTALMQIGPMLSGGIDLVLTTDAVSRPYLQMTAAVMAAFGGRAEVTERHVAVASGGYRPADYEIEPDASAASYFFAAAATTGGTVRVPGLGRNSLQGDLAFVDVLARMGADVRQGPDWTEVKGPTSHRLRGVDVDLADISDTAPTLAVVAALADGPSRLRGIGFIRNKESDRVGDVVGELRRLGVDAVEEPDGMVIRPDAGRLRAATVDPHGDHRLAMSFAVLGLSVPGVAVDDPACVEKTFPTFWDTFEGMWA
jgi:3-phosphoshikimate 1-carboxyvinyltransferase